MAVSGLKLRTLPAITVTTAGTRVALHSSSILVYAFLVMSLASNTGTQYLGDSTVTSANGIPFSAAEDMELEAPDVRGVDQFDLSKIYVDSSTSGAEFRVIAWIRE